MGLNQITRNPCGFCFVEYATREEAQCAVDTLNKSTIDEKTVRVDWDYGFTPERQFGRSQLTGGQVRDFVKYRSCYKTDKLRPTIVLNHDPP